MSVLLSIGCHCKCVPSSRIATRIIAGPLCAAQQWAPQGLYCTILSYLARMVVIIFLTSSRYCHLYLCESVGWVSFPNTDVSVSIMRLLEALWIKSMLGSEVRSGSAVFWRRLVGLLSLSSAFLRPLWGWGMLVVGFPNIRGGLAGWLSGEESTCEAGSTDSIPGSGRPRSRTWQPAPVFLF